MSYNGWPNYETWNVALWFGNDEGLYRAVRAERPYTAAKAERVALEWMPDGTPDFDDMGGAAAYDRVDWQEIAASWNEL